MENGIDFPEGYLGTEDKNMFRPHTSKLLATLALVILPLTVLAVDLETGMRNVRRVGDWVSLEFRDPLVGRFLASRASTEYKRREATLNVTFVPAPGSCQENVEILLKLNLASDEDSNRDVPLEVQFDELPPRVLSAKLTTVQGDRFIFFQVSKGLATSELLKHRSLVVVPRGWGLLEFSLRGFERASRNARALCSAFISK